MAKTISTELPNPNGLYDTDRKIYVPRTNVHEGCLAAVIKVEISNKKTEVVRECCNKVFTNLDGSQVCISYVNPAEKHRLGHCALASNRIDIEAVARTQLKMAPKKFVNPLKLSKRKNR